MISRCPCKMKKKGRRCTSLDLHVKAISLRKIMLCFPENNTHDSRRGRSCALVRSFRGQPVHFRHPLFLLLATASTSFKVPMEDCLGQGVISDDMSELQLLALDGNDDYVCETEKMTQGTARCYSLSDLFRSSLTPQG